LDNENKEGNEADFYVDDADLLEDDNEIKEEENDMSNSLDGSELDFDEEDYMESESEGSKDNLKKIKKVTKEDLEKMFKRCLNGNNFFINKIINLFNKIGSNKVETMDEDHILNMPKYSNKLIRYFVKDLPNILIMKINNVDFMEKNNKVNEVKLENDSENDEDENMNMEIDEKINSQSLNTTKTTIKKYLSALSKFIKNAESNQRTFIFKNLSNCADLIIMFNNYTEIYLKYFLKAWAGEYGDQASEASLQTVKTILSKNPNMFETALKLMYINYLEVAKENSWKTLILIKKLQEDIINILSIDLQRAYMVIFMFIRKLCIQLRVTINEKRSASIKNIYNWQFINSLKLWTFVLCKYFNEPFSDIKLLAYPLIQTIIGVIRLNLVDIFFPLRISLVNLLNKISDETNIFIPCENYLFEVLESSNFSKNFKNKILKTDNENRDFIDLNTSLKIKKEDSGNFGIISYLLEETLDTLLEFCAVNCYKISFPELGKAVNFYLRKITKNMMVKNKSIIFLF
jgi:hypothetical protein